MTQENPLRPGLIVEVAMEMALMPDLLDKVAKLHGQRAAWEVGMSSSVGGIGPLLRERVISQAEQTEVIGVSLLYASVWAQGWHVWGQMYWHKKPVLNYWHSVLEKTDHNLSIKLFDDTDVSIQVWKASFGKATVYFLDHPDINSVIYPGPEDAPRQHPSRNEWAATQRQKQSWILGRGTLALLKALGKKPDFIVQSETPTVFAHHRLVQDEFQSDPFFEKTSYLFNDHTPLEYAHPIWPLETIKQVKVDPRYYENHPAWLPERQGLDVTCLLISINEGTYGVSEKHARVMHDMPTLRAFNDKIDSVTNGVSAEIWQSEDFSGAETFSDDRLLALKNAKRKELVDWLWRRYKLWHTWQDRIQEKPLLLWTRRVTSYKRLDILWQILQAPSLKKRFLATEVVFLVGGRIHQNDFVCQEIMYGLLDLISQDRQLQERVVVIDNFNVWEARRLYQGADASIMLSDKGREASATGFMKVQLNGGMVICNNDGAIPESVTFKGNEAEGQAPNGFEVGFTSGKPTPEGFLGAVEAFGVAFRDQRERVRMIRAALASKTQVGIERTTRDLFKFYDKVLSRGRERQAAWEKGVQAGMELSLQGPESGPISLLQAPGSFSWSYLQDDGRPVTLDKHPRTLENLLGGFRYITTLGTVGDWSLLYHTGTPKVSLLEEIRGILSQDPNLKGAAADGFFSEAAKRSQTAIENLYKESMIFSQYELMGFIQGWLGSAALASVPQNSGTR